MTGKTDPAAAALAAIALGEDSTRQFKRDVTNGDALAAEMVAFANAEGGTLFLGVADDGTTPGLSAQDVKRLNQLIGNTANHGVRSPLTVQTKNVALPNGRVVIILTVPKGLDKPYFDKNGVMWLKAGADKRRVNSKEELRRLFQISDQFHADELPTRAGLEALDDLRFRDFLRDTYDQRLPARPAERLRLLANMNL
ncbi:MAG: ATP-binding protein, partial [Polyangiaceae bacterium]|nr:ATP-binding protein [Polyangiaceae bacterium]